MAWALTEAVKAFEKLHYRWNSVFIKFLVAGYHLDVHFLHDVGVQKRGVVVKLPALKIITRCDHQHHADALESADGCERGAAVNAGQLSPLPPANDSCLTRVVSLDLVHLSAVENLESGGNRCRWHERIDVVLFQACHLLI